MSGVGAPSPGRYGAATATVTRLLRILIVHSHLWDSVPAYLPSLSVEALRILQQVLAEAT